MDEDGIIEVREVDVFIVCDEQDTDDDKWDAIWYLVIERLAHIKAGVCVDMDAKDGKVITRGIIDYRVIHEDASLAFVALTYAAVLAEFGVTVEQFAITEHMLDDEDDEDGYDDDDHDYEDADRQDGDMGEYDDDHDPYDGDDERNYDWVDGKYEYVGKYLEDDEPNYLDDADNTRLPFEFKPEATEDYPVVERPDGSVYDTFTGFVSMPSQDKRITAALALMQKIKSTLPVDRVEMFNNVDILEQTASDMVNITEQLESMLGQMEGLLGKFQDTFQVVVSHMVPVSED